jgi:hypothetical protein
MECHSENTGVWKEINVDRKRDYREGVEHLLRAAVVLSPTGAQQNAFGFMVNDLRLHGADDREVAMQLMDAMLAGLLKNCWPVGQNTAHHQH